MGRVLHGFSYERVPRTLKSRADDGILHVSPPTMNLSRSDVYRWQLAAEEIGNLGLIDVVGTETYIKGQYIQNGRYVDTLHCLFDTVADRIPNWPTQVSFQDLDIASSTITKPYVGFAIAGALYGGLHLLAWTAPFASRGEEILWRASGLLLMASAPLILLFYIPRAWFRRGMDEWRGEPLRFHDSAAIRFVVIAFETWVTAGYYLFSILLLAFGGVYMLARLYLLVECFKNLNHLPPSAYNLPRWTQYFPHIG
jgi:hypothetical protein